MNLLLITAFTNLTLHIIIIACIFFLPRKILAVGSINDLLWQSTCLVQSFLIILLYVFYSCGLCKIIIKKRAFYFTSFFLSFSTHLILWTIYSLMFRCHVEILDFNKLHIRLTANARWNLRATRENKSRSRGVGGVSNLTIQCPLAALTHIKYMHVVYLCATECTKCSHLCT